MNRPRFYTWAHGTSPLETEVLMDKFPGLGAVLHTPNFAAARYLQGPVMARIESLDDVKTVASLADKHDVVWSAAIYKDELNADGPSGHPMPPWEYAADFLEVYEILHGTGIRVSTMGLQPVGGSFLQMLRAREFDDAYHRQLPPADFRAFNPNQVRLTEIRSVINMPGPWILSPAPFRGWWDRLWEPVNVDGWAELSRHRNVHAVALWCLREHQMGVRYNNRWQSEHGLISRDNRITNVGQEVRRALNEV